MGNGQLIMDNGQWTIYYPLSALLVLIPSSSNTYPLSIINYQLSIINYQLSIINYRKYSGLGVDKERRI